MPEKWVLKQYQALPLIAKVRMSQARIREWYDHFDGNVYVSFSGGKDSTVLANLVHEYYPDVPLVFCNTGLEYPEIQEFARKMGAEFIRPKMSFSEVISTYGYPIISKENAEAIHYARKIRIGGGYYHTTAKRTEFNSERLYINGRNSTARDYMWGGVQRSSITDGNSWVTESVRGSYRLEKSNTHRQTSYERENLSWGGRHRLV